MKVFPKNTHDIKLEDHLPKHTKNLYDQLIKKKFNFYLLVGFSETLKWLARILSDQNINFDIYDWRSKFIGYDLNKHKVKSLSSNFRIKKKSALVICNSSIAEIKDAMFQLHSLNTLNKIETFYYTEKPNKPYLDIPEFKKIYSLAKSAAPSMISDDQLFDLIQLVRNTRSIKGEIVEFGCYNGGSSAFIIKSRNAYCKNKNVYLFDTFSGIPKSKYGLDSTWTSSFSNNSYLEVKSFFYKEKNLKIIKGNLISNIKNLKNKKISFCYLASDTLESGEAILKFIWPRLSRGGIIAVCDYGSYPNCLPLTYFCDDFFKNKNDCELFYTPAKGLYIKKI